MIELIMLITVLCLVVLDVVTILITINGVEKLAESQDKMLEVMEIFVSKIVDFDKQISSVTDQLTDYQQTTRKQFRTLGDSFKYISKQLEKLDGDLDDLITNVGEDMTNMEYRYTSIYDQFEFIQRELKKLNDGVILSLDINPPETIKTDDISNPIRSIPCRISLNDDKCHYELAGLCRQSSSENFNVNCSAKMRNICECYTTVPKDDVKYDEKNMCFYSEGETKT